MIQMRPEMNKLKPTLFIGAIEDLSQGAARTAAGVRTSPKPLEGGSSPSRRSVSGRKSRKADGGRHGFTTRKRWPQEGSWTSCNGL